MTELTDMKLSGVTFRHAITLGPLCDDGRVEFSFPNSSPNTGGPGVYAVIVNDGKADKVVYVGFYQSGIRLRWVYAKRKDLYHFKKPNVAEALRNGHAVRVFAESEAAIKSELGHEQNVWVNSASIEAQLICLHKPSWNSQGKKKRTA